MFVAGLALWCAWAAGQLVRDANWFLAQCFYIPSPAVAALWLVAASWACFKRRKRSAVRAVLLALVPLAVVVLVENRWSCDVPGRAGGETRRLVHWNVCRGWFGWPAIASELRRQNADLVIVSEIPVAVSTDAFAAGLGADYVATRLGDMVVAAHGALDDGQWLVRTNPLKVYAVRWRLNGRSLVVFVVDVASSIFRERDPVLRRVIALMREHRPDIVVGDFNAPRRSRALWPLPAGYVHAYEAAGCGWSYTWPAPCPLWAIDHCIVGRRVAPTRYRLKSTWHSDHRLQVIDFEVRE